MSVLTLVGVFTTLAAIIAMVTMPAMYELALMAAVTGLLLLIAVIALSTLNPRSDSGSTGGRWRSKLLHVEYEGHSVRARHEYYLHLNHLDPNQDENPFYSVPQNSPFRSKITKATAYIMDLPAGMWLSMFRDAGKLLTHHYVEIETESGHRFTLEKDQECVLFQSCLSVGGEDSVPIVRDQRDGKKRKLIKTRKRVITELYPKNVTILDLLRWVNAKDRSKRANKLTDPYHVANSNCQHFAGHLWHQLSEEAYPNPSLFEDGGQSMKRMIIS